MYLNNFFLILTTFRRYIPPIYFHLTLRYYNIMFLLPILILFCIPKEIVPTNNLPTYCLIYNVNT